MVYVSSQNMLYISQDSSLDVLGSQRVERTEHFWIHQENNPLKSLLKTPTDFLILKGLSAFWGQWHA